MASAPPRMRGTDAARPRHAGRAASRDELVEPDQVAVVGGVEHGGAPLGVGAGRLDERVQHGDGTDGDGESEARGGQRLDQHRDDLGVGGGPANAHELDAEPA